MNLEILKSKIINAGIQGKLTEQLPEDGTAEELLEQIAEEKKQLIKEKKIKATKALPEITEDEIPFEIPENWKWVRLADICSKITSGNTPAGGSKGGAYVTEGNCFFREQIYIMMEFIMREWYTLLMNYSRLGKIALFYHKIFVEYYRWFDWKVCVDTG